LQEVLMIKVEVFGITEFFKKPSIKLFVNFNSAYFLAVFKE